MVRQYDLCEFMAIPIYIVSFRTVGAVYKDPISKKGKNIQCMIKLVNKCLRSPKQLHILKCIHNTISVNRGMGVIVVKNPGRLYGNHIATSNRTNQTICLLFHPLGGTEHIFLRCDSHSSYNSFLRKHQRKPNWETSYHITDSSKMPMWWTTKKT